MKTMLTGAVCALALTAALPASAQPAGPASAPGAVTLIQAGRLLDHPGRAPRGPSTIVVRDGKVAEIRDGFVDASAYPGATVVDQRDRFVLPGLIDSHVHLFSDVAGQAGFVAGITDNLPTRAYSAAMNARKTLMAGFTTVRNLGDTGGVTLALREETAAHRLPGPRIIDAGNSISTTSGHMDGRLGFNDDFREHVAHDNVCNGAESCREAVRLQVGRGVDLIKIATTGGVNSRIAPASGPRCSRTRPRP